MASEYGKIKSRQTVLFVEDERNFSILVSSALESAGFNVLSANDGDVATSLLKLYADQISLVLLDISLPKKDGLKVLKEMGEDYILKKIPVILLIDSKEQKEIEEAMTLGAKDYVIKSEHTGAEIVEKINKLAFSF